jgi:hypothetical protein
MTTKDECDKSPVTACRKLRVRVLAVAMDS